MSRMLTLFPASATDAETAGKLRTGAGFPVLRCADDSETVAIHQSAAELCLGVGRYRTARRHLFAALRLSPEDARSRFLLGRAYSEDPLGCDRRAVRSYRKAVKLKASDPLYRAALGRALVRINDTRSGVNVLKRAAEAAPADAEVLTIVVEGLREAGEVDLAFDLLSKARFLAPADTAVRHLWNRTRFDLAAQQQKQTRSADVSTLETTRVVPFIRLVESNAPSRSKSRSQGQTIRLDRPASQPEAHVGRLLKPFRG